MSHFSLPQRKLPAGSHAFTLIELLIVVAALSILSVAFFTVVMFAVRAEAEDGLRATLRDEAFGIVRAVLRDTHLARSGADWQSALSPGTGGRKAALSEEIQSDSQTLVLEMDGARKAAKQNVVYRLKGPRLERLNWSDTTATPTVQTLSDHVRAWRIERSGDLVRVNMELAINRYTRDFTAMYSFSTRVGGVFREPSWRSAPPRKE